MKHIVPHLWFDTQAKEAAEFYVSAFENSKITNITQLHNTPSGDTDIVSFELAGHSFMSISAGPYFTINPSVSFLLNFDPSQRSDASGDLDALWKTLSEGGKELMPLGEYPFSKHYGWIQDKYGVSWQLMLTNPEGEPRPFITPALMYTGDVAGRAEEAIDFYCSVFKDSKKGTIAKYPAGMEPDKEGTLMFGDFSLLDTWFAAMDSAHPHGFVFNEAISFMVPCDTQEEIDYLWEKLSADPSAEQCGWLKDKFGLSWQITSTAMDTMMTTGTPEQVQRVTKAFLGMKKFNIAELEAAFNG
jgi:predicted 3-demethylubiquinone-9 3-methyltransferase (glyoxalase superfamily)